KLRRDHPVLMVVEGKPDLFRQFLPLIARTVSLQIVDAALVGSKIRAAAPPEWLAAVIDVSPVSDIKRRLSFWRHGRGGCGIEAIRQDGRGSGEGKIL